MSVVNNGFFSGVSLIIVINLLLYLAGIAIAIIGFIFLVKFLRAGTRAFNLYVQINSRNGSPGNNYYAQKQVPNNSSDDSRNNISNDTQQRQ